MVRKHYYQEGAIPGPNQLVEFQKDMITLDIPIDGVTINDDWRLMPLMRPVVSILKLCKVVYIPVVNHMSADSDCSST